MRPSGPFSVVHPSGRLKVNAGSSAGNSTFFAWSEEERPRTRQAVAIKVRSNLAGTVFMPRSHTKPDGKAMPKTRGLAVLISKLESRNPKQIRMTKGQMIKTGN